MSPDFAIHLEGISKRYVINHEKDARDALRHRIEHALRRPFRWLRKSASGEILNGRSAREEFWALQDVSLEIAQGDTVGVIGKNGAGKSTLLKLLSRITEPTTGRIQLRGRVASLLEVGTGFHQELTGRENIYLNGAILGMTRAEIRRKFDEIVAFSEIEKFLDTPVKRYSTGMYVRLAFAVAAHLEPEILIVDEVLAVGDASFQKKCLGKMGEVAHSGRTVLFVSHNMSAVQALCRHAIFLRNGRVRAMGPVEPLINQYLAETGSLQGHRLASSVNLGPSLKLACFEFSPNPVTTGRPLRFSLSFLARRAVTVSELSLLMNSAQGSRVALIDLRSLGLPLRIPAGETWHIEGHLDALPLVEGDYSVGLTVNTGDFHENLFDLVGFTASARKQNTDYAPYAVCYRGLVELDFKVHSEIRGTADSLVAV